MIVIIIIIINGESKLLKLFDRNNSIDRQIKISLTSNDYIRRFPFYFWNTFLENQFSKRGRKKRKSVTE